jgi:uncharacterized protein (DUF302 family)
MPKLHSDYVTKDSPWSVVATAERLTDGIAKLGMTIFATIDQRAAASGAGLQLRETVLIVFGNPAAGTAIMEAVPLAALDLPLKLLIWDDRDDTRVSYVKPAVLNARNALPASLAAPLAGIETLVDAVLSDATGKSAAS